MNTKSTVNETIIDKKTYPIEKKSNNIKCYTISKKNKNSTPIVYTPNHQVKTSKKAQKI